MTCNACNSYFLTNTKKPNKQADMAEKSRLNISLSIIKTFIFYTLDSVFNLPKYFLKMILEAATELLTVS